MKIGIIGTGNMGRILAEALIDGNAVSPSSMTITNRTLAKALDIQKIYPSLAIGQNAIDVAENSDAIFICVKPHNMLELVEQIKPALSKDKCIISITSPISVEQLERKVDCSVIRIIPSITNRALAGVSLFTYGTRCSAEWKNALNALFKKVSVPVEIEENITRVASDIVSCGPAFFSHLVQSFISAAVKETEIDQETATVLASEMLIGLGELLSKNHYTLPTLQEKVCVKGGITGEGIKVLDSETGDMFEKIFQATHKKFEEELGKVQEQFGN
ncbi:late competence protein ComER [Mesobacillus subterraneus]|uniref:late competence protein ComER n=1 Tax=Mesobacillus subterraneus TaxID=285983 RepID=UPI00203B4E27|nr:late competence protein ComER [Mesobacillus subterraneus]MCM3663934.1 late competence protein ComER [Mesobacillus subterraneus]MCM3683693.1 late competence protein ComER [Mesobacillus subterraneus]